MTSPPRLPSLRLIGLVTLLAFVILPTLALGGTVRPILPPLGWINVVDFGAIPNDDIDDTDEIQAAIDAAQVIASAQQGFPTVYFPNGHFDISDTLVQKASAWYCPPNGLTTRFVWNGDGVTPAVTKAPNLGGSTSYGGIIGCHFYPGTGRPLHWLDLSGSHRVDVSYQLDGVHMRESLSDAIVIGPGDGGSVVGGVWNLHWRHLRFDGCGRYCIKLVNWQGAFLQTFKIEDITWDNRQLEDPSPALATGLGFLHISADGTNTSIGTVVLENMRAETNQDWAAATIAVVTVSAGSAGVRQIVLRDFTYQDVSTDTGDYLFYSEVASGTGYILDNVHVSGLSGLSSGFSVCTDPPYSAFPHSGIIDHYRCGDGLSGFGATALYVRGRAADGTNSGLKIFQDAETVERIKFRRDGPISLSDGTNAADVTHSRLAANRWGTDPGDDITSGARFSSTPQTATCADSGNGSLGTLSLQPTASVVKLVNSDADGCTVTMSETSALDGSVIQIVVTSSAGGTVNFADSAGVSELAGAYSAAVTDTLTLLYTNSTFYELARSNN